MRNRALVAPRVCPSSPQLNAAYPRDSQGKDNNVKWCFGASYLSAFLGEARHTINGEAE